MSTREVPDTGLVHFDAPVAAALDRVLVPGALWVTDADGTLWDDDVGEGFLRWASERGLLVHPDVRGKDAWAAYEALLAVDKRAAYGCAVQWLAGISEADVVRHSEAFVRAFVPPRAFAAMRGLVAEAHARGARTFIVSASHEWVVKAAAPLVGIDPAQAIGLRVHVEAGVLTDVLAAPFTWKGGKVEAIERFIGQRPAIVTGDSTGDVDMLALAEAPLVIAHRGVDPAFVAAARARGWLVQRLGADRA